MGDFICLESHLEARGTWLKIHHFWRFDLWKVRRRVKATSHSTIFDIPMRPVREDQKHRRRFTR